MPIGYVSSFVQHTYTGKNACLLAFILCVKAVLIAFTSSIPELGTSVCLFVIVPADDVVTTGPLAQDKGATRIQRGCTQHIKDHVQGTKVSLDSMCKTHMHVHLSAITL